MNQSLIGSLPSVQCLVSIRRDLEIAALLLRRIYEFDGLGREAIPHLTPDGEMFDPAALRR